jgi:hypothetical protein
MPSSLGQIINQYLFKVPQSPLKIEDNHGNLLGRLNLLDFQNFLKILAAWTCSYTEGTFTGTLVGASNVTGTFFYRIIGNMAFVTLLTAITGAGSTTGFQITGVPIQLQTTSSQTVVAVVCEDNSVVTNTTNLVTGTSSTWTLGKALTGGSASWTAANTKGILPQTFEFPLD